ncbi:UNVERIFIED_CONTAM: putative mitochondrial protein [Sesamum radiatum]|uniref:Mitochondrial protein n=1 Tax=Sesamum radiatum TaxID=300843 RepID=A0AAW2LNP1_SESRA
MLAKLGWRLLTRSDSMLSRVLKAKYFSTTTFGEAQLGSQPSLTLRSIIGAWDLLLSGCCWKIRSGTSVRVWGDNWLPKPPSFRVNASPWLLDSETRVSVLIDEASRSWKMELVTQVFEEEEAKLISSIALQQLHGPDTVIWHYSNKGTFSVSSAYRLALQHARQQLPSTSTSHNREDVAAGWSFIWRSHVPPKVQTFVWRACHEAMPTV